MFDLKPMVLLFVSILLFSSCGGSSEGDSGTAFKSKKEGDNTVMIHELADSDKINPILSTSANSTYIESNVFQSLLYADPETLENRGLLAISRPEVQEIKDGEYKGGMSLTYEIRPEATWDNGTPILAEDYLFTIKAIKNPKVMAAPIRPYMEFIHDIVIDKNNPRKFTIFSKDRYILAEDYSGYNVYPKYAYDPDGLMDGFTIKQLNDPKNQDKLSSDKKINAFAERMNDTKYSREPGLVVGSGPYEFTEWETGQRIVLKRKANWWGDKLKGKGRQFNARPEQITHKIVSDWTTAITAMKDEGLDVARQIRAGDFMDLKKDKRFTQMYNMYNPVFFSYDYLGFNMKKPYLSDKRVRRAIAHLVDTEEIIEVLLYGLGERTIGPIHPSKPYYNKSLSPIEFNIEQATKLLAEAGWKDSDGDGIVDKEIDGERISLKLTFKYNAGNDRRKNTGLLLKENAKRAGIDIEVLVREWTVYLEETKRRDYDIMCLGWVQSPSPDDLKQIWHTESDSPDGSNRVGFGNEESDKIIEEIRITLDENKRKELYLQIQEIIYDEQPYVFLYAPKERIAIHNRFKAGAYVMRPGYEVIEFQLTVPAKATEM